MYISLLGHMVLGLKVPQGDTPELTAESKKRNTGVLRSAQDDEILGPATAMKLLL